METDIQSYIRTMPQGREPLNFLQGLLDFQASLAEKFNLSAGLKIGPAVARAKWQGGQFLLAGEALAIPTSLFRETLADLRPLLPSDGPAQTTLDQLLASNFTSPSKIQALLDDLMADSVACFQQLAETISADPEALAFLLQAILSPLFEQLARPYWSSLEEASWRRGICPICGCEPGMARLTHQDGQRLLACSLCRTEWSFDRLCCPFCSEDDQAGARLVGNQAVSERPFQSALPRLHYFSVDDDEAHRVDCCDRCQRYLKTVDERLLGRPANLMIEEIVTAHLDILAREYGYR